MINSDFLDQQKWRYATKKFDPSKKSSENDLNYIIEAAQLSTSSYGLQPYQLIHIKNDKLRQAILPLAWQQKQIIDASDLFIIANHKVFEPEHIDGFIEFTSNERQIAIEKLLGYQSFMKSKIFELNENELFNWTQKQCYLVLANMMLHLWKAFRLLL
jgi:nitroreductase